MYRQQEGICCCQHCCDGAGVTSATAWLHSRFLAGTTATQGMGPQQLLSATIPRLPVGLPSFMVAAAEVQLGRCSLRKRSSSPAFTRHIPALKGSGAAGAARIPSPGCQLCVSLVTTVVAPLSWTPIPLLLSSLLFTQ